MNALPWIVVAAVVLVAGWWMLKIGLANMVPPEVSSRALLKQELKRRGVDVARIPDRAIDEIVQHCLSAARGMAMMNQYVSKGRAEDGNWRANLVRQLQVHAPLVQNVMAGGPASPVDGTVREILIRNGVVRP